jgi:uncharacterized membrane protein
MLVKRTALNRFLENVRSARIRNTLNIGINIFLFHPAGIGFLVAVRLRCVRPRLIQCTSVRARARGNGSKPKRIWKAGLFEFSPHSSAEY